MTNNTLIATYLTLFAFKVVPHYFVVPLIISQNYTKSDVIIPTLELKLIIGFSILMAKFARTLWYMMYTNDLRLENHVII